MSTLADDMANGLTALYGDSQAITEWIAEHGPEHDDIVRYIESVTLNPYADGLSQYWAGTALLTEATAFWRAADYSGSGVVADGSGNGHDLTNNGATFLAYSGEKYVYLPGIAGNYVSTPDAADLDITGDLDVRVYDVAADDWTPASERGLIGKYDTVGNQRSWDVRLNPTGTLSLHVSGDGAAVVSSTSTVPIISTDGSAARLTFTAATGIVRMYASDDDGDSWTLLYTSPDTTARSIFAGSASLKVGAAANAASSNTWAGRVGRAEVRDGIDGTVVASWSAADMGQTGGTSGGRTWTINRATTGRKSVVVDRPLFLLGTDDTLSAPDHADLDFAANEDFTAIIAMRATGTRTGFTSVFSKKVSNNPATAGWSIYRNNNQNIVAGMIADGTDATYSLSTATFDGSAKAVALRRDTTADLLTFGVAGALDAGSADVTTGTLADASLLTVGGNNGAGDSDMEFMGAAIYRRALTDDEIALVGKALGVGF